MHKKDKLEGLGVKFRPESITQLVVVMPSIDYTVNGTSNKYIQSITYNTETIEVGDRYTCNVSGRDIEYKVNAISRSDKYPKVFRLLESTTNTSTLFVLPLLFETRELASYIEMINGNYTGYLVNCYVDCDFIQMKDGYSVMLLLKFSKSSRFKAQEEYFINHQQFVNKYDVSTNYVAYEFSIPDEYRQDFLMIMNGRYSLLSSKCINKIIRFHGSSIEATILNKVLTRHPDLVKDYEERLGLKMDGMELWSKINEDDVLSKDIL